jgi:thioredoxin-like negative regulator of GroEL
MSIQSGQFDKAVGRFEVILKQEPENKEALYLLAQAYDGKGDKKKAVELLEKCKKLVNDPEFSKEIDEKINSLK